MKSYRIVIEYTDASDFPRNHPILWDWHDLVAPNVDEALSVVSVEEIETPAGHVEDIMQDGLGQDAFPDEEE